MSLLFFTSDTAPIIRFFVTADGTTPVDLTQCLVYFYIRRTAARNNLFGDVESSCIILPDPLLLTAAVTLNVAVQSVAVSAHDNIAVGNSILVDTGVTAEVVKVTASADGTHLTGVFTQNHAISTPFVRYHPTYLPTLTAPITLNVTPQSVAVSDSSFYAIGNNLIVGKGLLSEEIVTITAIADSTHLTAAFLLNHTAGEFIDFVGVQGDLFYTGKNGYCIYEMPAGGLVASTVYQGQLKIIYPDGTVRHSDFIEIDTKAGL